MYKIVVHKRSAAYLCRLPLQEKERVIKAIKGISNNPDGHLEVKRMAGEWKGYYRVRIGNFRVIFWLDKKKKILYVDHVGPRGDIYKK